MADAQGKFVYSKTFNGEFQFGKIEMEILPNGLYFMHIETGQGRQVKKLKVQKE